MPCLKQQHCNLATVLLSLKNDETDEFLIVDSFGPHCTYALLNVFKSTHNYFYMFKYVEVGAKGKITNLNNNWVVRVENTAQNQIHN